LKEVRGQTRLGGAFIGIKDQVRAQIAFDIVKTRSGFWSRLERPELVRADGHIRRVCLNVRPGLGEAFIDVHYKTV
jgi:hypothetical protein